MSKQDVEIAPTSDDLMHVARLVTIGELSACFAHDVNNPLMLIRGHLRYIDQKLEPDHPLRASFEAIERSSRRIEDMARRMLSFSRKRTVKVERHDIGELVADAWRFMEPHFQEYTEISMNVAPGLPPVEVDRWQMLQALVNLLQNAAEAMVNSTSAALSITVRPIDHDILISIGDTGRGIAAEDLQRIFTPFFTTKGDRGTGLGLYVTRRIIEEHGGTIAVQSCSKGTTFTISLPLPE
jgi:two-component system NtrC family sensor kinase